MRVFPDINLFQSSPLTCDVCVYTRLSPFNVEKLRRNFILHKKISHLHLQSYIAYFTTIHLVHRTKKLQFSKYYVCGKILNLSTVLKLQFKWRISVGISIFCAGDIFSPFTGELELKSCVKINRI